MTAAHPRNSVVVLAPVFGLDGVELTPGIVDADGYLTDSPEGYLTGVEPSPAELASLAETYNDGDDREVEFDDEDDHPRSALETIHLVAA